MNIKIGDKFTLDGGLRNVTRDCTKGKVYEVLRIIHDIDGNQGIMFMDNLGDMVGIYSDTVTLVK